MLTDLRLAFRFLTRLPIDSSDWQQGDLGRASWAFPLVGVLIGLAAGVVYALGRGLGLTPLIAGVAAVAASVILTGALHEDGLADMADGLGGKDKESRLAIMRDPHVGTYGVVALTLTLIARVAAISYLSGTATVFAALVVSHAAGRTAIGLPLAMLPAARADGLGADAGRPSWEWVAAAAGLAGLAIVVVSPGSFTDGLKGLLAVLLAFAAAVIVGLIAWRKFGGQTGDVLGAAEQAGEVAALCTLVALT
jgi:adenosylcobinamide-GDP ribazoletransferase